MKCNTMKCNNRFNIWGAVAMVAAALNVSVAAADTTDKAPAPATGGAVAAEVNNEKILVADVDRLVNAIKARYPELATGTEQANQSLASLRQSVLDNLITQRVLIQEARKRKIAPPKADVDTAIQQVQDKLTDAEFQKELAKDGKTVQDLRQLISRELAIEELTKQLTADVVVTDEDVSKFYRENPEQFVTPEAVRARHILIQVKSKAAPAEKEKARKRAQDVLKLAQAKKADFGKLARENSDDAGSKEEGGDLGFAMRGQFVKPFEDAIFSGPVGKVIGPIETEFGFHIIKVEEKSPPRTLPLNEVKNDPKLKDLVRSVKMRERFNQRVDELKNQAKIKKYI